MKQLRLHNTLTGKVEPFAPERPPEVRMYVCGLTVYGRGHIGNYRTFVATDLLRRTLKYKGFRVKEVMNITDVDDRIITLAAQAGKDLRDFTAAHIKTYEDDLATLRLERPEVVPRALARRRHPRRPAGWRPALAARPGATRSPAAPKRDSPLLRHPRSPAGCSFPAGSARSRPSAWSRGAGPRPAWHSWPGKARPRSPASRPRMRPRPGARPGTGGDAMRPTGS